MLVKPDKVIWKRVHLHVQVWLIVRSAVMTHLVVQQQFLQSVAQHRHGWLPGCCTIARCCTGHLTNCCCLIGLRFLSQSIAANAASNAQLLTALLLCP